MKNSYYFSHDYSPRSDEKIKRLIRKYGMAGYGVYWSIVEDLYVNANALQTDYNGIAYDLRVDSDMIESIINDFELFVIDGDYFGSNSVQRRLDQMNLKSAKASEAANYRWNNANALQRQSNSNAIKEKKVNEKKDICTVGAALSVDDFYRNEIEKSGGDKNFEMVVSFILGSNDIEKRLNNILKVKEQLSYNQFKKIWEKYRKLNDGTKLSNILLTMENDPKYTKNKVSLYLTLNNWISKRFVK